MVMHAYNHGLITIDIQYVEQTSTHKSLEKRYSYKVICNSNKSVLIYLIARPITVFGVHIQYIHLSARSSVIVSKITL